MHHDEEYMLKEKYTVLGRCAQATFEIIVVTESQELPVDGGVDEGRRVWLYNPSESTATSIEAGGFMFGLESCGFVRASDASFDPASPCSVLWSFARPGRHEKVSAESASLHVEPADISVDNVGFFFNFGAAMEPDRTWEWVAPKLVMYGGGAKATFEPKPNSSMVRFVATKKINIPGQHCVRF